MRPITKVTLKSALVGYEKVREAFARVGESIEDITSEVRSEIGTGAPTADANVAAAQSGGDGESSAPAPERQAG